MDKQIELSKQQKSEDKFLIANVLDKIKLSNNNETEFMKKSIGKTLEVLFEEKQENGYTEGHTTNYIVIEAEGENLENTIQKVKIDTIEGNILRGKIL